MADAASGVSENLMDSEATNGSSDSNTSGSALLSRKGLFGKSGVLNQNLETTIATEKEVFKPEEDKSNGDGNDGANTSGSGTDQLEVASNEDTTEEDEPHAELASEKTFEEEQVNDLEPAEESKDGESMDTSQTDTDSSTAGQVANSNEHEIDDKNNETENGEQKDESDDRKVNEETDEKNTVGETDYAADEAVDDKVNDEKEHDEPTAEDLDSGDSVKNAAEEEPEEPPLGEQEPDKDKEPEAVVEEEVCVKKIISMDTDDVDEDEVKESAPCEENEKEEPEVRMEITEITVEESYKEICEEVVPIVEEPEGAESECMEEGELEADEKKSEHETVVVQSETVVVETVTETVVTDVKDDEEKKEDDEQEGEEEEKEAEEVPKRRASSRRAAAAVSPEKKTPPRAKATPARRTPARKRADEEKADDEEKPEEANQSESKEAEEKEEPAVEPKLLRSRSRRSNVVEPKAEEKTPVKKRGKTPRSAKKDVAAEAEDESEQDASREKEKTEDMDSEPTRCSLRSRAARSPTKQETPALKSATRRGRSAKNEDDSAVKKEAKTVNRAEAETPRRGRRTASTTAVTTPAAKTPKMTKGTSAKKIKEEDHDPYDIDTEIERHPEPLKNIQMEVQSFGEVKYAKTGSGKYEHTEKTAESRVGNLAELAPRTKQRKSLADLTPGRKKASPSAAASRTAPQPRSRKAKVESDEADKEEEHMEMEGKSDVPSSDKKGKKSAETPKSGGSARKRRGSPQTIVSSKRVHVEVPQLSAEDLLTVDNPQDDHAAHEAGARVYAMFDGLFYPAIVMSRDGLGRYKVSFVEDGVVKDVPPAGVIPLRALDLDKECYFSDASQKDRLAVKVLKAPDSKHATAWQEALFELEHLDDEGNSTGEKLKGVWTNLALSKDDWREYINKKSREATDIIADNIESTEDRHTRRSKVSTPVQAAAPTASKSAPRSQKKEKETSASATPKNAKGRSRKKAEPAEKSASKSDKADEDVNESAPETSDEQIFVGKLFILTSANRPNVDTGFKKKFMTDFISSHGGLVVDDMKEVDEHPEMERFLISDTHYRTHKYLAALVRAMPCVSHEWIYKCLDERKLVDYRRYLLPSGVSILDDREYPLPKERGVLLRNKRVMVHSNVVPPSKKSMSFEQIWVPMVPHLGGEIVTEMPDREGKLDILLTDHSATPSLVEKARKIGASVVSSEWLIQGIIMDRLPDVSAHQKFLHNGGVCT